MDWVIEVEVQFPNELMPACTNPRQYLKDLLQVCIQEKYLTYYHLLSEPRQVDS